MLPVVTLLLSALDAPIVPGAQALPEAGRYESRQSYEDTLDYYRRYFRSRGGVRWQSIVNRPEVRAKHLQNLSTGSTWSGINIYEHQGKVYVFVLPRAP
jgi:hypothetical protein